MKEQIISLRIVYDPNNYAPPMEWSWSGLLDLSGDEEVELLDYSPVTDAMGASHD